MFHVRYSLKWTQNGEVAVLLSTELYVWDYFTPITLLRSGHISKLYHQAGRSLIRDGVRSAGLSDLHSSLAQTVHKSTTMALWCKPIKRSHYLGKFALSHILSMHNHQTCGIKCFCVLVLWKKCCSLCTVNANQFMYPKCTLIVRGSIVL